MSEADRTTGAAPPTTNGNTSSTTQNPTTFNQENPIENIPRDVKLMSILLQSHGIEDCDQNVVHQLLEFGHRKRNINWIPISQVFESIPTYTDTSRLTF